MGKIGSFGDVVFETSFDKILTPSGFTRSAEARWSTHDVMEGKPIPEFIGSGQESISFKIILSAALGVSPDTELQILRDYRDNGQVYPFILGTKPVTSGNWYIESISETYNTIDQKGNILSIDADLTLKEYPVSSNSSAGTSSSSTSKPAPVIANSAPLSKTYTGVVTILATTLNCRSSPSLNGNIVKVLRKNEKYKVYGTKTTDITWYVLGGGLYCSASSKYTAFTKG